MGISEEARKAAGDITAHRRVTVISHIDADGISGEAILVTALTRAGVNVNSVFVRQLEPLTMPQVPDDDSYKVFVDLGAGQQNLLEEKGLGAEDLLIIDHHVDQPCGIPYVQLNSLAHGIQKISAAGLAYLVAKAIDSRNSDLAKLAVIGNVGDMMAREDRRLSGTAREIVEDGVVFGNVVARPKDLNCYGTATRPLHVCLSYNDDPFIRGISNNMNGALQFLKRLDIPLKTRNGDWLRWDDYPLPSQRIIISALVQQMIANGEDSERIFCESYTFPDEPRQTPLRNAQEFATVLNACGRWAKPRVGSDICRGDRGVAFREAEKMLSNHRAVIRELLQYILDTGVSELSHMQYIHVGNRYPDTIVGIGAGMALAKLNREKPILILVELPEDPGLTKASMRTSESVVGQGVDLQDIMTRAASEIGGAGGGHKIAAGAYIPKDGEGRFISRVNDLLGTRFTPKSAGHR
jgi:single-stranded-DNA-specific exonuclease